MMIIILAFVAGKRNFLIQLPLIFHTQQQATLLAWERKTSEASELVSNLKTHETLYSFI
jgi:hypothetical protein